MKVRIIRDDCGAPYLVRITFFEFFRRKDEPEEKSGGYSLKLHIILKSDEDRAFHDHPWTFATLMLCGGYFEHTPNLNEVGEWINQGATIKRWIKPWTWRLCRSPYPHRLELSGGNPAVTLVFMCPRIREWGFYTKHGWVPWFLFKTNRDC